MALEQLKQELENMVTEKQEKTATLIRRAVEDGIRVDILVHSLSAHRKAWSYLEGLGFSKETDLFDVLPGLPGNRNSDHLQLDFWGHCI